MTDLITYIQDIVDEAWNVGYRLEVDNKTRRITLSQISNTPPMPKIEVSTHTDKNVIYFRCRLYFPMLNTCEDEFVDDIRYVLNKWLQVANLVECINEKTINLEDIENERI